MARKDVDDDGRVLGCLGKTGLRLGIADCD